MILANLLPPSDRLPPDAAVRLVAAYAAEFEALKTLDPETLSLHEDPLTVRRAVELSEAWARWADEAQAVLDRISEDPALTAPDRQKFAGMIAHARHIAGRDAAELRRRLRAMDAGEFVPREQARRELGRA